MKILVTGGAGFIGANFILYWMKQHPEDSIVNLDALTYAGNLETLRLVEKNSQYSFVKGDICDMHVVDSVMQGVDTVVHFAAESHVDRSILDASSFIKTNVLGTQVLLEAARKHNVKRFHHVSTDEVFGSLSLDDTRKFTEETTYNPRSPYAASKAGSDHIVRAYHTTYGLPITITNCSNNFGPYQFPEKLIALAITNILEGKSVPIYGDGLNVRDWLYVEDHARAIETVLQKGRVGQTYVVGGMTKAISNKEVVEKILRIMGKDMSLVTYVADRPGHDRKYDVDWTKIKTELSWEPLYQFDDWLEKTVAWYTENQQWWKDIKTGAYKTYYETQYKSLV